MKKQLFYITKGFMKQLRLLNTLDDTPVVIEAETDEEFVSDSFQNFLDRGWKFLAAARMTSAIKAGQANVYKIKVWAFENEEWKKTVDEGGFLVNTQFPSVVALDIYDQIRQFYKELRGKLV